VFATSPTLVTPALGTPASGVVTNLTGTASININGTVGATTPNTGSFTVLTENAFPVVTQTDIGTAPNQIPLNQYLGDLAYQDAANIAGPVNIGGALTAPSATFSGGAINNTPIGAVTPSTGSFSALTVNGNNISADNSLGFRNRIINGDMRIDQRNAGASVTVASGYTLDRWSVLNTTGGTINVQQSSTAPSGFRNSIGITVGTADTSVAAGDSVILFQTIEGFNLSDLGFGTASPSTITISFWVQSSLVGTYTGSIVNGGGARSYPFQFAINSANTWEQKTITLTADTTGTWELTNGVGAYIEFSLICGSTFTGTAGSWQAGNFRGTSSQVNWMATSGNTFRVTGVQLEAGSVATPFERRPYGTELALCQRYACSTFPQGVAWGQNQGATGLYVFTQSTSARVSATFKFPVSMRATPTIVSYNPSRAESGWENISVGGDVAATISGTDEGLCTEQAPVRTTLPPSAVSNALVIHLSASAEL